MNIKKILLLIGGIVIIGFFVFSFFKKDEETATPVPDTIKNEETVLLQELPPQAGLLPKVEATRQAIYKAALSRDYERLASVAGKDFVYSFGGEYEGGFAAYLELSEKDEKETAFDIIPRLLALPYGVVDDHVYVWPSVFAKGSTEWTEEDIALMKTFLSEEQIEDFREFGGYIYYRLGIDSSGEWSFYVAGD